MISCPGKMFTGIIEALGKVRSTAVIAAGKHLTVIAAGLSQELKVGESVAVNGVCLTVVDRVAEDFTFQIGPETLHRTNLGELATADAVNLERALRLSDRLNGHLVQGHVDGLGRIEQRVREGNWESIWFSCPSSLTQHMVPKGSIAVDGISLTLVEVASNRFSVALIPHTLAHTTLGHKKVGDHINIETDIIAKYVARSLHGGGINSESLKQAGFFGKPDRPIR